MPESKIRLMRPSKTKISLRIRAVISVFADCMFLLQPPGYPKRDKPEPFHWWMYRLIRVFSGHPGLIVGFVVPSRKHAYIILTPLNPTFI